MLFNSYIFILFFLPTTILGYFVLNRFHYYQIAKCFLILMSLYFYAYFNISYLWIIISSVLVNYLLGMQLLKKQSKLILSLGIAFNLGLLFYFKYFDFFISNINTVFSTDFHLIKVILPLGISFFTFQQLSFIVESYKQAVPKYNFVDYALFVTFFPQLIAGPIVLHNEIIPQFIDSNNKSFNAEKFSKGIYAFSLGLAKKVLLADTFGLFVNYGYNNIPHLGVIDTIFVLLGYTFQIYFDFSGYCDMAIGIGLMFNIIIPINFNSPYKSTTISDFWKRWHITLTRFFTQYVYIPLGGNKTGKTYVNIFIVFLLSGFWHGANWTFILWGIMHGIAIILYRMFKFSTNKYIDWVLTFIFVNIAWCVFRADSITVAYEMIKNLFNFDISTIFHVNNSLFDAANSIPEYTILRRKISFFILYALSFLGVILLKNTNEKLKDFTPSLANAIISSILLFWSIVSFTGFSQFLYFNF